VDVTDELTEGESITLETDLVILVTGMEARANDALVDVLKIPVGRDGFFNEVHPKLRPVETVMDGLLIAGAAQGPKSLPESVASAMSAVAKTGALLLKGYLDLEPFVASVDPGLCTWCNACAEACPYQAIGEAPHGDKTVAVVNPAICKGCGVCVAPCESKAINVEGYTHDQITSMIDALAEEVVA
jgi:heterodisulfide reductase subunit A